MRLPVAELLKTSTLAGLYFVTGSIGLVFDAIGGFATLVWAPTGIALAALLIYGYRLWPGVALGALLVNAVAGAPVAVASGIALGNTLEALAGAYALRRLAGFHLSLDRVRDVVALVVLAAGTSTLISATLGVASLWLGHKVATPELATTWLAWWWGDLAGALLVAPLLLTWSAGARSSRIDCRPPARWPGRRVVLRFEWLALGLSLILGGAVVFFDWGSSRPEPFDRQYLLLPGLIWAAVRFGPRGAASAAFLIEVIAIAATALGSGPFAEPATLSDRLLALQWFMATSAVIGLVLGAVSVERAAKARLARDAESASHVLLEQRVQQQTAELRRANLDLMQREEQLRQAQAIAQMGSFEWDLARDQMSWSDELERIHGLAKAVVVDFDGFLERIHPEDRLRVRSALERARAGAQPGVEYRILRPDGSTRVLQMLARVDLDSSGQVVRVLGTCQDITMREQAEQARARLAAIVESSEDAIVGETLEGVIESWNRGAEQIYGFSAQDAVGQPMSALVPEAQREELQRVVDRVRAGERVAALATVGQRSDGSVFDAAVTLSPILDVFGRTIGLSMITRDVTEQRRAETKFRRFVEAAPDGMIILDKAGKIVLTNSQAERLFGYQRVELLGKTVEALIPQRFRARHVEHRVGYGHEPRARPMGTGLELFGLRKDGTEFPVEISLAPIETEEGVLVSAAIRDVTDRKIIESQLKSSLAEKEVLLQEIHHRVKNNLQVIASLLSLQASMVGGDEARRGFEESQRRIQSMALLHQLLYQSRDLSGIDFVGYLRTIVERLSRSYGVAPERIIFHVGGSAVRLDLDTSVACGLIVNELVSNAIKHAFPEGRRGRIEVSFHRQEGGPFVLQVKDDGVGISEAAGVESARTLGLTIVRTLTRQLGGTVEVARAGGTTFRVTFPGEVRRASA